MCTTKLLHEVFLWRTVIFRLCSCARLQLMGGLGVSDTQELCFHNGDKQFTPVSMEDGQWGMIWIECAICKAFLVARAVPFNPCEHPGGMDKALIFLGCVQEPFLV